VAAARLQLVLMLLEHKYTDGDTSRLSAIECILTLYFRAISLKRLNLGSSKLVRTQDDLFRRNRHAAKVNKLV